MDPIGYNGIQQLRKQQSMKDQIKKILSLPELTICQVMGISSKDEISSIFGDDEIFVHNNLLFVGVSHQRETITTYVVGEMDEILETFSGGEDVRFQEQPPETGTIKEYVETFFSEFNL